MTQTLNAVQEVRASRGSLTWWQVIAAGAVGATIVNLVILFIGGAAGASFGYVDVGVSHEVTAGGVLLSSTVPLIIGTALAVLLARWRPVFLRLAQVIGPVLAVLSIAGPLSMDADTATKTSLALMHLVIGVAVVVVLAAVRRTEAARD